MTHGGRRTALLLAFTASLALGACTVMPRAGDASAPPGSTLSGRMSVRVEGTDGATASSVSAAFELQGNAEAGTLNLATPLGSVLAQARWSPGSVLLTTPQGESRFSDLDALTREVLGEPLPIAALFDWLKGRPWPGATSHTTADPREPGFEQLGWVVDLARFSEAWVVARRDRAPLVTVRAKLDLP